ncbi:DUF4351 domain-containing protein [Tumidithrix helvetica PCC 7403]|uniref:Rpn family recombination-promoting nuclease/putative transposase n=1 Tax=Tumidithrix helvetica TaxID=3457545 RepID=UPI003CB20278
MFDSVCRFLAETFSQDFAIWLIGEPIILTELSPTELSLEPIRADSLVLLQSQNLVLHLEFQTQPDATMPFRMMDYRIRVYRRFPEKQMRQVVIYLVPSTSEIVYQTAFSVPKTHHEFEVVRLWEHPPEVFQHSIGLLPFAVLSQTDNREEILRQVAKQIEAIGDPRVQSNVAASTAMLAGLLLEKGLIQRLLRSDIMKESVIYQEMRAEALAEARAEVLAEALAEFEQRGLQKGQIAMLLRLLTRKFGKVNLKIKAQISKLSIMQLENLAEAILDFNHIKDLEAWLKNHS